MCESTLEHPIVDADGNPVGTCQHDRCVRPDGHGGLHKCRAGHEWTDPVEITP